jgi:hypothetical protein
MPHHIPEVAQQGIEICVIPAAAPHIWREAADESKFAQGYFGLAEHGRCHAMVSIENRQRFFIIDSNQ